MTTTILEINWHSDSVMPFFARRSKSGKLLMMDLGHLSVDIRIKP